MKWLRVGRYFLLVFSQCPCKQYSIGTNIISVCGVNGIMEHKMHRNHSILKWESFFYANVIDLREIVESLQRNDKLSCKIISNLFYTTQFRYSCVSNNQYKATPFNTDLLYASIRQVIIWKLVQISLI